MSRGDRPGRPVSDDLALRPLSILPGLTLPPSSPVRQVSGAREVRGF